MITRKKILVGGALATVAAVALGATALYYTIVPHDTPERATLSGAVASLNASQAGVENATAEASALTGTWVLATNGESFVGYRVKEELATVGTFTAVGRTTKIEAALEFDGTAIADVEVTADLTGLTSDNSMRDGQLRRQALETDAYPTATFDLTQPIALASVPADGQTVSAQAIGNLTLHGVTRTITIPLQGQFTNGYVVVVGSLDIAFADFGIEKPRSVAVLGIDDHGVLELQLVFQQGRQG